MRFQLQYVIVIVAVALVYSAHSAPRFRRAPVNRMILVACARNPRLAFCPTTVAPPTTVEVTEASPESTEASVAVTESEESSEVVTETVRVTQPPITAPPAVVEQVARIAPESLPIKPVNEAVEFQAPQSDDATVNGVNPFDEIVTLKPVRPERVPSKSRARPRTPNNGLERQLAAEDEYINEDNLQYYCEKYEQHYYYYCNNITLHKRSLQVSLFKYCPLYSQYCQPAAAEEFIEFPDIPTQPVTTREPCTRDCEAPHCTTRCICDYYRAQVRVECTEHALPLLASNCELWHKHCDGFYQHKEGYRSTEEGDDGKRRPASRHNGKKHTQWWKAPDSTSADWLNGNVGTGQDWEVPAVGIGGTVNNNDIDFPSIGGLLGKR